MKKTSTTLLIALSAFVISLSSCKKDDDSNTNTNPTPVSTTDLFDFSDSWGLLAGVKTVTFQTIPVIGGTQEIDLGTAVVAFNDAAGSNTYLDAGTAKCNTKTLTKQSNNSYVFQPSQTDITGIDFSSGSDWEVTGAGSIPAITHSFNTFPTTPTITSNKETVTRANGYTFSTSSVSYADSVLYVISSGNNYVKKSVAGNVSSVTFTASELSTLDASSYGLIQVTPYAYQTNTTVVPGKKVYFVNQVTVSDIVEVQ